MRHFSKLLINLCLWCCFRYPDHAIFVQHLPYASSSHPKDGQQQQLLLQQMQGRSSISTPDYHDPILKLKRKSLRGFRNPSLDISAMLNAEGIPHHSVSSPWKNHGFRMSSNSIAGIPKYLWSTIMIMVEKYASLSGLERTPNWVHFDVASTTFPPSEMTWVAKSCCSI